MKFQVDSSFFRSPDHQDYTGDTDRKFETRKKEHQDKVRLTRENMEEERYDSAENRMNSGDDCLARHAVTCGQEIDRGKGKRWTTGSI